MVTCKTLTNKHLAMCETSARFHFSFTRNKTSQKGNYPTFNLLIIVHIFYHMALSIGKFPMSFALLDEIRSREYNCFRS